MARYRDLRGRFTTESIFRSLFPEPAEEQEEPVSQSATSSWWNESRTVKGYVWSTQTYYLGEKPSGDVIPLDLGQVRQSSYPGGSQFNVVLKVADNSTYPRPYITAGPFTPGEWPPSPEMWAGYDTDGIVAIFFRD